MKVLYLNCATRLSKKKSETPQRLWLQDFVVSNNIDVVCLAESSNYNFIESLPETFKKENCWFPADSALAKYGYKMNICSKEDVVFEPLNYVVSHELIDGDYEKVLIDYGTGTMIVVKLKDIEFVAVHIQHPQRKYPSPYNLYYEIGLRTLYNYMEKERPIAVFGDFNNYPGDASFEKLKTVYRDVNTNEDAYSYIHESSGTKFLLDHTFTVSDTLTMKYIDTLSHGFDHKGMLINIE